ncbi:MAG TPA: SDR family NAD(P)-dependent oxidoreductase [Kofleriaceae bacterium]|nr:SDR family NAD(P)-dependent oxidoreductase [Kofleriaceae bacterium]
MTNAQDRPVALVTGASSGFGLATAARLHQLGYHVVGTSRRAEATGPDGVEMVVLDVDRDDSVAACVAEVVARTGRIDVVVNNAGRALVGACEETSADEARALFETNLFGVMRVTSAVLPTMRARRHGAIVNVGSLSGFIGVPFHGVYAATKHALAGYSEALRYEVARFGIRVALIEPAAHRTGIQMARPRRPLAVYDPGRDAVEQVIRAQIDGGRAPGHVVDAIVRAATGRTRRFRRRVGGAKAVLAVVARLFPGWLFDRVVRREFRLDGR